MSSISTQLHLKQQQKLVMTPMLQQALKILQMNTLELGELIEQELEENPILEEVAKQDEVPKEGESESEPEAEASAEEQAPAAELEAALGPEAAPEANASEAATPEVGEPGPAEAAPEAQTPETTESPREDNWEDYFDDNGTDYKGSAEKGDDGKEGFESFLTARPSLQEHLLSQWDAEELEDKVRELGEEIIGRIDEKGFLEEPLAEIASQLKVPESKAFETLRRIQKLDPSGVGARDLRECLLLQLEARALKESLAWKIVSLYLPDLERQRLDPILKGLKISLPELREAEALIATLEPNPGRPFGGEPNPAVQVDASVEKMEDGSWQVFINDRSLPRLGFNQYYRRMMKAPGAADEDAKKWLKAKYESALWLIRGIEQRHKTLRRVLEEIVAVQQGFFEQGPSAFQPLTLKDIALKTHLHESTVSRVTSSKYVQTPRGVFELKYFFTSGLKTQSGEDASSMAVKESIRDLLEEEDPLKPLSDQQIAESLMKKGIQIARRTVAKYREELGLLPAHRRKEGR
jgi:RNA polymerase sigma-54 factor